MTEKVLHSFTEMIAHLESGGAAHRFGSYYPLYRMERGELKRRVFGGSAGWIENGVMVAANFSPEEQKSADWVLLNGDQLKQRDEESRRSYQASLQSRLDARPPLKAPTNLSIWQRIRKGLAR
jgi:hypothetical protein